MSDPNKPINELLLDPNLRLQKLVGSAMLKVNNGVTLIRYYRALLQLAQLAHDYVSDGNIEKAFVMSYRFSWFAHKELENHVHFKVHYSVERKIVEEKLPAMMSLAEKMKKKLLEVYKLQSLYYQFEEKQRKMKIENFESWKAQRAQAIITSNQLYATAEKESNSCGLVMGQVMATVMEPKVIFIPPNKIVPNENWKENQDDPPPHPSTSSTFGDSEPPQVPAEVSSFLFEDTAKRPVIRKSPPMLPGTSSSSAFRPVLPNPKPNVSQVSPMYPELLVVPPIIPGSVAAPNSKCMIVPLDVVEKFLEYCQNNTALNIETCGILSGHYVRDRFVVTHLVLPKQIGTIDGCSHLEDANLAHVLASSSLMLLGWIHTHISRGAYMTTADLHTHYAYQKMIDASIAMVCSPSYSEVSTFTLTRNGMITLAQCEGSVLHNHNEEEGELYETANHVHYSENNSIIVFDLR